jgi:hypothetical protein
LRLQALISIRKIILRQYFISSQGKGRILTSVMENTSRAREKKLGKPLILGAVSSTKGIQGLATRERIAKAKAIEGYMIEVKGYASSTAVSP